MSTFRTLVGLAFVVLWLYLAFALAGEFSPNLAATEHLPVTHALLGLLSLAVAVLAVIAVFAAKLLAIVVVAAVTLAVMGVKRQ